MFGGSSNVSIDSPNTFQQIDMGTDEVLPHLRRFSERIHSHGAALMCQLTHLGRRGDAYAEPWLPMIAPSPVRETLHRAIPQAIADADIKRVIGDFGRAARRCLDGGLDGLETLAGGHLIGQFMDPTVNLRNDRYGGSAANRCRFAIEVHEEIRKQVGDDHVVGLRFALEDGCTFEESLEMARILQRTGLFDFFNVIYGRMDTQMALLVNNMPTMSMPAAPWLSKASALKQAVQLPVFHAAKISDLATARYAIREGLLDMVGMTRAHIAPRKVLVVGAGPAGLEAARVCAARASSSAGGQLLLAASGSWRKDLIGIVDWRRAELERMKVEIRYNHYAELSDVVRNEAEVVIIATGGVPNMESLPGSELCKSVFEALTESPPQQGSVLVYDGTGRHNAYLCAERYVGAGLDVSLAIIDGTPAQEAGGRGDDLVWMRNIAKWNAPVRTHLELVKVTRNDNGKCNASFRHQLTGQLVDHEADHIVVERGTIPVDDVFEAARIHSVNDGQLDLAAFARGKPQPLLDGPRDGKRFYLYRIGDASASRDIHTAIYDAYRLCVSL